MAPIVSCAELLKKEGIDTESRVYAAETIHRQVAHMTRLVDDLLDVSRMIQGKIQIRKIQTSLKTIITRAVEVVAVAVLAGNYKLCVVTPDNDTLEMFADEVLPHLHA
jgi:K+-sensing histidine kinase KdpD